MFGWALLLFCSNAPSWLCILVYFHTCACKTCIYHNSWKMWVVNPNFKLWHSYLFYFVEMLAVEMWVKNHQQCPTSAASMPYLRHALPPPVRLRALRTRRRSPYTWRLGFPPPTSTTTSMPSCHRPIFDLNLPHYAVIPNCEIRASTSQSLTPTSGGTRTMAAVSKNES
jgi:hypothetical protein